MGFARNIDRNVNLSSRSLSLRSSLSLALLDTDKVSSSIESVCCGTMRTIVPL